MTGTPTSATTQPQWLTPRRLDRAEQGLIVVLWAWLVWRVLNASNAMAPLVLIAETSVLIFVLLRRPTDNISLRLGDWLLAITATAAPLLLVPADTPALLVPLESLAVGLVMVGNVLQIFAKFSLNRSFGVAPANRGIKTDGLYRFVRHPIYAGYLLAHIGVFLLMPSLFNLALYVIGWWAQILRLLAEEALLGEDPQYRAFMQKTRWRLIPGLF
jgi:protein-S-isoprenylcysteine O-methyltransferase Ste14